MHDVLLSHANLVRLSISPCIPLITHGPALTPLSLGETGVGKSCLIKRYCEQKFQPRYIPTIRVDFGVRSVNVDLGPARGCHEVKVNFWDLSGDNDFSEVRNEFMGDTQAALLVFDVTNRVSFAKLGSWLELLYNGNCNRTVDLLRMTGASRLYSETNPRPTDEEVNESQSSASRGWGEAKGVSPNQSQSAPVIAVVANKCDESVGVAERQVLVEEARAWANKHGFQYFETSAKSGDQVNELFATVLEKTLSALLSRETQYKPSQSAAGRRRI